ncbi:MAG: aldehyde ferredoxin oxidoreductase family protein, partial [Candidatus Bathyarchaeia archaeon]
KILHVDLSNKKVFSEELKQEIAKSFIGGRGFAIKMLYENVTPNIDPLSPDNLIIFATGPLNGTITPGCSRTHISSRSPQTRLIGWANVGGHFASALKQAGFDLVIVKGKAEKPVYLSIINGNVEIKDALHIWGKGALEAGKIIIEEVGNKDLEVLSIGQAGENLVKFSAILSVGRLSGKAAARTGMGAIMGSKKLKAIAAYGEKDIEVANPEKFMEAVNEVIEVLKKNPASLVTAPSLGTSFLVKALGFKGSLVTWNFQKGKFEYEDEISGEKMREKYLWKAQSCFACPQRCTRYVVVKEGPFAGYAGKGPEFETLAMLGSNIGIGKLDAIIGLNDLFDEYGMDTISGGNVIGFAMELYQRGILTKEDLDGLELEWGNVDAVLELTKKIVKREGIGNVLAEGVKRASEIIGKGSEKYAMHTKGLEHIGGDPRGQTGFTLGYVTCSRGADHLGALPVFEYLGNPEEAKRFFGSEEACDRFGVKGKGRLVKWQEELMAIEDSLVICKPVYSHFANSFQKILLLSFPMQARLYSAATGIEISEEEIRIVGERIVNLERAYNVRIGITRKDDTLPERFLKEPLSEGGSKGYVVNLDPMLDEYYEARGWNVKTGIPLKSTFKRLGLEKVAEELKLKD